MNGERELLANLARAAILTDIEILIMDDEDARARARLVRNLSSVPIVSNRTPGCDYDQIIVALLQK